jgi:hypothetical protein
MAPALTMSLALYFTGFANFAGTSTSFNMLLALALALYWRRHCQCTGGSTSANLTLALAMTSKAVALCETFILLKLELLC